MCISTPDVPTVPERQETKLPDQGANAFSDKDARRKRRAMIAGLVTTPTGALGAANTTAQTLG